MTAPAHVLVFRPIVDRLRERGHEVELTARDYSQTVELMHMHGLHATVFGRHGGASRVEKALALANQAQGGGALPSPITVSSLADCAQVPAGVGGCP